MPRLTVVTALVLSAIVVTADAQQKELQVVASSPQGVIANIGQSKTIFVSFGSPMVALQAVPKDEGSGPMTIEPRPAGKYRWMGTSTLTFIPERDLPYATSFAMKVPAGTTALDGRVLSREFSWSFETPRPSVTWTSPANGASHVDTSTAIHLRFNQPVDPGIVARNISIILVKAGGRTVYPEFTSARPDTADKIQNPEQIVILRSKESFGMGARVTVNIKEGVRGMEGPLPMSSPFAFTFTTYGELLFLGIYERPDKIYPQTGITLVFSNGVTTEALLKDLTFAPAMKSRDEYYSLTSPSEHVYIPLPLLPESTYTGTIRAGLRDRYGNTLKSEQRFTFQVQPYLPFIRTRTGIGVLEGYESHKFPVTTMNVDSFRVQMGAVNPERIVPLMQRLSWDFYTRMAIEEGILLSPSSLTEDAREFTRTRTLLTRSKRNTVTVRPLDFDVLIGKNGRGILFVQVDDMFLQNTAYLKTLVQVTDFGITAKFSPDANLIWVTNLRDASPVSEASVEIRDDSNKVVWQGKTDEKGLVKSPGWGKLHLARAQQSTQGEGEDEYEEMPAQPRQWVIVRKGENIAFTCSQWDEGIEPYRFDVSYDWNPQPETVEGVLLTDRGLYKAGEQVDIKGIIRRRSEGDWRIPQGLKTRLVIRDSRNEEVYRKEHKLSVFGSFAASLPLKPAAPLGYYFMSVERQMMVRGRMQWRSLAGGNFRVEAFRAAEFEVTAKFGRDTYTIGDTITGFLNAKYLYGPPLKDAKIRWRLSASRGFFTPPGFEGYFFGRMGWLTRYQHEFQGRELQNKDTTLDAFGSIGVRSLLRVGELQGTISLMLEGDVTSPSRQMLSGRTSLTVHPGEFYVGVRPSTTFGRTDSALTLSLVAVTKEGRFLEGQSLTVKILQRVWHSVRKAETGGRYAWYSVASDTLIDSTVVSTTGAALVRPFTPATPGFYYVDVTATDARGNALGAQTYFYATGRGYVAWERTNDDRIDLIANKSAFRPGETASIIVKNPYERATALVSVEREGIILHYTTVLEGSAPTIELPITSTFLPNVYVSVVLLQGRTDRPTGKEETDAGRPSFKVGYVALSVSPREKKLTITVEPDRKEYRPGDSVVAKILIRDMEGKPRRAEIALSVADLGVLNLVNYRMPNPFETFYHERGLAVVTTETRMHIIEQRNYDEKGQEVGGGGAAMKTFSDVPDADGIRKIFRPSAYWNPSLVSGSDGIALVRFKLPDNLTAFAMMAVAQTKESEFGYGDSSFAVTKPLLLQPSLPRFVRVGDSFKSGVVVMNTSPEQQSVTLVTKVTGLQWRNEDTTRHLLQPGQAKEVLFGFAAEKIGTAKFVFRARSESNSDGLQWTIPVTAPRLKETVALYESLPDKSREEHLKAPVDAFREMGNVEFTSASTAMVGLSGGISYLFHYPYGCLEQRASSVLPMILAKDLVEAFKFDVLKDKDYRAVVMKTLDEIPLFQKSNGGFAYWKNADRSWSYISAYAMYTLVQAQRNGYKVDKRVMENGIAYLKRVLSGDERDEWYVSKYYSQCTRALILYTLSLSGKPEFGYMETLYNERNDMPLFPKAYLLKALHAGNGNRAMQNELVRDLSNRITIAPTSAHFEERSDYDLWFCFDSNTRTTALIMQALVETQPESPLIPKIVRWLIDEQRVGRWRTTQENLYVVDALATFMRTFEKEEPDFRATITMGGKAILQELFKGRSFNVARAEIPLAELAPGTDYPVLMEKEGQGRLYYGIRMNYYPTGETPAKEEGFSVVKSIETLTGGAADTSEPGTLLKVTLTVSSNQYRHFVVVDDPVPAGFEVVNTSFQTTAANLTSEEGERSPEWYWYAFHHVEKYDDRVLLFADSFTPGPHSYTYLVQVTRSGSYRMPSTRVEGMYEPEVFGQTASRVVEIR